jgi:hypothetical protein
VGENMEKNIGNVDKIVRVILAVIFAYFGYSNGGWYQLLYILTVMLIITTISGFCLPYRWLGINTAKK